MRALIGRTILIGLCLGAVSAQPAEAQWVVHDSAIDHALGSINEVMGKIATIADNFRINLRRVGRVMSLWEDFNKFRSAPQPLYRTRRVDPAVPVTVMVMDAINGLTGEGLDEALPGIDNAIGIVVSEMPPEMRRQLALYEIQDSAVRTGIAGTGLIRGNRKIERGIKALQIANLVVPGSMQKILDEISGSAVLGAQQRSAKIALLTAQSEQRMARGLAQRHADADALAMRTSNLTVPAPGPFGQMSALVNSLRSAL